MLLRLTIAGLLFCMVPSQENNSIQEIIPADNKEIAFASDTQAPLWVERLMLKSNRNRTATRMIFNDMLARKPIALFLLGDVVSWGSSNLAWRRVSNYLDSFRAHKVPVYATMGNHELMGIKGMRTKGQRIFEKIFPEYLRTGFAQVVDSIAIILLNSNFSMLSKAEDTAQIRWYEKTLAQMDADPAIQYIITGCHHSPFSNSRIVGSSKAVQQRFVTPFMHSHKTALFLSGHAHAFEHFKKEGKDFMVIGGGGGVHQPLNTKPKDLIDMAPGYKPMFHYLSVKRQPEHLQITSHRLNKTFTGFDAGMTTNINRPLVAEKGIVPVE
jgi:predicted MPP superfamily phosphohydrolase